LAADGQIAIRQVDRYAGGFADWFAFSEVPTRLPGGRIHDLFDFVEDVRAVGQGWFSIAFGFSV
jgi:hypothetical protein